MKTRHRLGLFVAMVVVACGVVVSPAHAQNTNPTVDPSTAKDCQRGYTPGQWVQGNPPAKGVQSTLVGARDHNQTADGYILNVTLLFDGYAEGWYVVVGAGVTGDFDSHSRMAMLRWCEKYDTEEPASTRGGSSTGHYQHAPSPYHLPGVTTKWIPWKVSVN